MEVEWYQENAKEHFSSYFTTLVLIYEVMYFSINL